MCPQGILLSFTACFVALRHHLSFYFQRCSTSGMKETVFSIEMGEGRGNRVRGKGIITCSLFEFIFEKYLIKPDMYNRHPN